jgi:ER membrane protein complex subunit 2
MLCGSLKTHVSRKVIWKREISVLRKIGKIENAIEQLSRFVDTFYTDVEAWLELADLYASYHQYEPLPIDLDATC